jgi:hypothetical protein
MSHRPVGWELRRLAKQANQRTAARAQPHIGTSALSDGLGPQ